MIWSATINETRNRLWNGSVNTGILSILMRDEIDPETSNRYFRKVDSVLSGITEPSEQAYRNFQRHVDRLCLLIVASDCSDREIDIERLHLRVQAAVLFPEKMPLYDMVYETVSGAFDSSFASVLEDKTSMGVARPGN